MPDRLIRLAIEALESRKAAIDAEIAALRRELRPTRRRRTVRVRTPNNRPRMSAAARNALGKRMKAYWVKWRAERGKKASAVRKPGRKARSNPKREENRQ
jgi:hypothetical protein